MLFTRTFERHVLFAAMMLFLVVASCGKPRTDQNQTTESKDVNTPDAGDEQDAFFSLALAQWSLHKMIQSGEMDPVDFAQKANELGFRGIEYVSALYDDHLEKGDNPEYAMQELLTVLKKKSEEYSVENVLIMVDGEGHLAELDEAKRNEAVENHKKWVDAAAFLGCHSIRVNAHGEGTEEDVAESAVKGLSSLAEYASSKGINVIVENHGGYTSNGKWLAGVMQKVNMPNCGTLPDFGNFCINVSYGSINAPECENVYDIYMGVAELLPYAKGVSAKAYDFDQDGKQPLIDYVRMLKVVRDGGYTGYIGVEYEGDNLSEIEGIKATRDLIIRAASQLKKAS